MDLELAPMGRDHLEAWLDFFDRRAFSDNPEWASCYCMFHRVGGDWAARTAAANRAAAVTGFEAGTAGGILALSGGEVVGWCRCGLRSELTRLPEPADDLDPVGAIVCFVVDPRFRRSGAASALLEAACAHLARAGAVAVEGYPRRDQTGDAQAYEGPLAMYLSRGFVVLREEPSGFVVRRMPAA